MVRKVQFSREDVVQAAFTVVRERGIDQLTARNVAGQL
jgi:DNA-binding transcriptional regulator YbjK